MDTNTERRLRLQLDAARSLLDECMEFLADHADVRDSDSGPRPNRAMALHCEVEELVDSLDVEFPRKVRA